MFWKFQQEQILFWLYLNPYYGMKNMFQKSYKLFQAFKCFLNFKIRNSREKDFEKEDPEGRLCLNKKRKEGGRLDFASDKRRKLAIFLKRGGNQPSEETEAIIARGHLRLCTFHKVKP